MTRIQAFVMITVLCAFPLFGKAQSSLTHPYEGATHTYVVNGLTPGIDYLFYVSANEDGSGVLDDGSTFEFDFLSTANGNVEVGQNTASLLVAWNNGAAEHAYYLWIELTNPGGCSTKRGLKVLPQANMFDLLSENLPVDHTESCPAISEADGFNPLASEYEAGTTTLKFKVRREGGNRGWMFEPVVKIDPSWNLDISVLSVVSATVGELEANASNVYTVPATDDEVIVNVAVRNYEGTEQVVTLEVVNQQEEQTNLNDSNPLNDKIEHRLLVMPVISDLEEI
jgi:hypothetical protein